MRRTKQQLQQIFDSTLQYIRAQKNRNINGYLNNNDIIKILDGIRTLRKLMKCAVICTNRRNKAVFSPKDVFIGWG